MNDRLSANKRQVYEGFRALFESGDVAAAAAELYAPDAICRAFHPVDELRGRAAIVERLWQPLRTAMPDAERRELILAAGSHEGRDYVAALGHLCGTLLKPLFDVPPTNGVVQLRYGEIHELADGRIRRSWVIADLLDLLRQAGCWPIAPSLGAEQVWPGPATADGVRPDTADERLGTESLRVVRAMHDELFNFDGVSLDSMRHEPYWGADFMWFGPAGIGTTRGLDGFRLHHQIPFLRAFPDRRGGSHIARIGDGNYVVTGGWPSVVATHSGPDWLGLCPTGKPVGMRVMDFYRLAGGLIAENWIPIDMIDILRQLGTDVLGRVRHLSGRPRRTL